MLQTLGSLHDAERMYRWFAHMRTSQPIWWDKQSDCWHVFRYEDVRRVTTDFATFSSAPPSSSPDHASQQEAPSLVEMDPPRHHLYRHLVSSAFTARAVERLAPRIRALAHHLLIPVLPRGHMDVIADLASPLSTLVMSDLLGLPEMDHIRCQQWAEALFFQQPSDVALFNEHEAENEYQFSQAHAALQEMTLFFQQLLAERHFHPQDDLISHLLATEVEGTRLRQGEILSFCLLLFLAGQVTTTHLLGQCLLCLDAHPEALYQLRADPTRIPGAIEEVLRFAPPVWRILRYTRAEVEIAGACLPANAKIFAWLASANRDERSFSSPRSFDIARVPHPPHLSFGQGVHFCLGAPLARLETSIALSLLLTQLPNLRVVKDPPLELLGSHVVFGVKRLPVTFTPGTI